MVTVGKPSRMREAYPRLDLVRAMAALRQGRPVCVFMGCAEITPSGLLEFRITENDELAWFDGEIVMRNIRPWFGPSAVSLVPNPNGVDRDRRAMVCPNCDRRCMVLTWIGSWRCRRCDGLLDRRQLIGVDTAYAEELQAITERTAGGRKAGQHQVPSIARSSVARNCGDT